jgi:xylan 1,4-beta-xylosidase
VGPALAEAVRTCDGHVDMLSFWTFSDVFEEGGVAPKPFEGQFGLRAMYGINKPSFYDFMLLHELGDERMANDSHDAIVTRASDGSLRIAVWNLSDPVNLGPPKRVTLQISGVAKNAPVLIERVDEQHGNALPAYKAMGSPIYPLPKQVEEMNRASALGAPERQSLKDGSLTLELGPNALYLVRVEKPEGR